MDRHGTGPEPGAADRRPRRVRRWTQCTATVAVALAVVQMSRTRPMLADTGSVALSDPHLQVTTVLNTGLAQPTGIVFLAANDFLVLERASGQVKRIIDGVLQSTPVLDLPVNSNSERGLLSMALDPGFPAMPFVYVCWVESSTAAADSPVVGEVPRLRQHVDRYLWTGSALTFDRNLLNLRSRQTDNAPLAGHDGTPDPADQGNHDGGVLKFGPDGNLYIVSIADNAIYKISRKAQSLPAPTTMTGDPQ